MIDYAPYRAYWASKRAEWAAETVFGVTPDEIRGPSTGEHISMARSTLSWWLKTTCQMTPSQIGVIINRHRTSIYTQLRAVKNELDVNGSYSARIRRFDQVARQLFEPSTVPPLDRISLSVGITTMEAPCSDSFSFSIG